MNPNTVRETRVLTPAARLMDTVTRVAGPAIVETMEELRKVALASTAAREVNAAKLVVTTMRVTLARALEAIERAEADITNHWHACLEREATQGDDPS